MSNTTIPSPEPRFRDRIDCVGHNLKDIIDWVTVRRPDLLRHIEDLTRQEPIMAILAIGYSAGRASAIAELEGSTVSDVARDL